MGEYEEDQGFLISGDEKDYLIRLVLSVDYVASDYTFSAPTQRVHIVVYSFSIIARTPKGVWIRDLNNRKRFVLLEGKKRYAYPTIKEAYDSFIVRKTRERIALEHRLDALKKLPQAKALCEQLYNKLIASGNAQIQL